MKKILVCFLVLSVMLAFAACAKKESPEAKNPAVTDETTEEAKSETKEKTEENYEKIYEDLTCDYKKLVEFRYSDSFDDTWYEKLDDLDFSTSFSSILSTVVTEDHSDAISGMIEGLENTFSPKGLEDFGYILYDLNKDGTPELFWVRTDYSIVAVFTVKNGEAVLLDAFGTRYKGYVSEKGELYGWGSGGEQDQRCGVYRLTEEGQLENKCGFSAGIDFFGDPTKMIYKEVTDSQTKEITAERFESLEKEYPREQSKTWTNLPILELK